MLMGMTHERDGLRRQLIEQINSRDIPACFVFKLLLFFTRHCLWQDYKDMWGFKSEELANTHTHTRDSCRSSFKLDTAVAAAVAAAKS